MHLQTQGDIDGNIERTSEVMLVTAIIKCFRGKKKPL